MKLLVVLSILVACALVARKAIRNWRVNAVITSDVGRRYLANLEATGQATDTANIGELGDLVKDREAIVREARAAGINLELIDALIRDATGHSPRDSRNQIYHAPAATPGEGHNIDDELYRCGARGSAALAASIGAIGKRNGMIVTPDQASRMYVTHAHALVWFTISSHLPAEEGKPLMQGHLVELWGHLVEDGESVSVRELEATVSRQWMAYVRRPEAAGGPLFALASMILKNYIPADRLGVHDALAVSETIIGIVKDTRSVLVPAFAS
jgi:hypothetical protein